MAKIEGSDLGIRANRGNHPVQGQGIGPSIAVAEREVRVRLQNERSQQVICPIVGSVRHGWSGSLLQKIRRGGLFLNENRQKARVLRFAQNAMIGRLSAAGSLE
jgi:hypothetical protein